MFTFFKDLNEKDLKPEKADQKLCLMLYAVKNFKTNQSDGSLPLSRLYAGGGEYYLLSEFYNKLLQ